MEHDNNNDGISHLISKEVNSTDKIYKPDFSQKTGRELLAFYLQTKFKQILAFDKKAEVPVFIDLKTDFIPRFTRRLINNPSKRILIGITGESASGKSTMCSEIASIIRNLSLPVSIVTTDNYFKDISELIKKYGTFDSLRDNGYDIDSPTSFQLDVLKSDLESLSQGEDVMIPEYLPNGTGISIPKSKPITANKIIVVEGMATMYEEIRDIFDVKIYIEADNEIRKERFLKRACQERNQDYENALKHWDYILEAGKKYVVPARSVVDMILNGGCKLPYFSHLLEYLHAITNNFEQDI
jgi:uridine kinase